MTAEITEEPVLPVQEADAQPSEEAPYGWMTDPVTNERRPKKRPGRRSKTAALPTGKTPPLEELQALGSLAESAEDTAPGETPKGRRKGSRAAAPLPPFRAGQIAKVVNRRYRQAGRIVRMFDYDIGTAIIATTRKPPADPEDDDEDVLTAGEAWEALAKHNPRVRAFLMKLTIGGAYSDLFNIHLPILLAILMKDGIRQRIPLLGLAQAFLSDEPEDQDDAGEPPMDGLGGMMAGFNPGDLAQMMEVAQQMMGQAAMNVPRPPSSPRGPVASHPETFMNGMEHPADQG